MGNTFENLIELPEVSIAIEQLLVAPFGTSWTPGRIDIASPPSGFTALGAVDEEASVIQVTRAKLELRTGIPQVLQFDAVTGLEGKISTVLLSNSNRKAVFALGGADIRNISPATLTVVSTPAATATIVTLAASPSTNVYVGDDVVATVTTPGYEASQNFAVVASINGLELHFEDAGFGTVPGLDEFVGRPLATRLAFGTSIINRFHLLGVADFIDGKQVIHQFPKVSAFGDWVEEIKASQTGRIPVAFDAFGQTTTIFGGSELIVGERYFFPKV